MANERRKESRMPRRDHKALVAEAGRMERAMAACGWRLAELMSPEERASALLAASVQLAHDRTPVREQERTLIMLMEALLPDKTPAGVRCRAHVMAAVKESASVPGVARLMIDMMRQG